MTDLYFDYPLMGYLLLVAFIILYFIYALYLYRRQMIEQYTSLSHRSLLVFDRSFFLYVCKGLSLIFAWILACIALMGPKGNLQYQSDKEKLSASSKPKRKFEEVILLIDTSNSMSVLDGANGQSRLSQGKQIAEEIVSELKGQSVSVYSFTSILTQLVPSTMDYIFTRLMIKEIGYNEGDQGGTNYLAVFKTLKETIFKNPSKKMYSLIILSDGGDSRVEQLQGDAKEKVINQIISELPSESNLHIYTVGVGSEKGGNIPSFTFQGKPVQAKLEHQLLQQIAESGRGVYYSANEFPDWRIGKKIVNKIKEISQPDELTSQRKVAPVLSREIHYDLYFQIPLGLSIFLMILYQILPDTWIKKA